MTGRVVTTTASDLAELARRGELANAYRSAASGQRQQLASAWTNTHPTTIHVS
jgi:hypothetical protein